MSFSFGRQKSPSVQVKVARVQTNAKEAKSLPTKTAGSLEFCAAIVGTCGSEESKRMTFV
ncbi:hypothetical protein RMSM_04896 [Rhodopirellula maiorica SM1]|uniref:Uncharacterized protein n=1 Tax=Rhodopirellula maiorica SM1 TaxID=1265738 RepID=M5RW44_9BACT|nr:hypothetical protein RMSM_04896 [Rhodopirellula maiorica SM1]